MDATLFIELLPTARLLDIHTSASIGCDERVRDIIENSESKSILDKRNRNGWTPLMYAICCANLKVVLLLLEEGADTDLKNNEGHTALILASKCGSADVVNLLIDNGAKVNDKDLRGWTALFYAVAFGHTSVVQLLIERGAIVDIVDGSDKITPLMLAAAAGHERIVHDFLQRGVNINVECRTGDTARSLAVKNGYGNVKNLIDSFLRSKRKNNGPNVQSSDLASLLRELQLTKYYHIFEHQGIDINTFYLLTDDDLKEIGIQLLGPRKKMCMAISQYRQELSQKSKSKETTNMESVLMENKKLQQLTEKLKGMVLREQNSRIAVEENLADVMQIMKNYSDKVNSTVSQAISLSEKQKENHNFLRRLLCIVLGDTSLNMSLKPTVDSIIQSLDFMQELIEMQHQNMFSIKWTNFPKQL